jgi:hypothetical protein
MVREKGGYEKENIGARRDYMNCLWVIEEITNEG